VLVAQAGSILGEREVCIDVTANGCALSQCTNVSVTNTTDIAEPVASSWFSVQPNPSTAVFHVIPTDLNTALTLTVYDATGRTIMEPFVINGGSPADIDLGSAAPGAYYLLATANERQQVVKLMVQR
jgi:hypothetical protein